MDHAPSFSLFHYARLLAVVQHFPEDEVPTMLGHLGFPVEQWEAFARDCDGQLLKVLACPSLMLQFGIVHSETRSYLQSKYPRIRAQRAYTKDELEAFRTLEHYARVLAHVQHHSASLAEPDTHTLAQFGLNRDSWFKFSGRSDRALLALVDTQQQGHLVRFGTIYRDACERLAKISPKVQAPLPPEVEAQIKELARYGLLLASVQHFPPEHQHDVLASLGFDSTQWESYSFLSDQAIMAVSERHQWEKLKDFVQLFEETRKQLQERFPRPKPPMYLSAEQRTALDTLPRFVVEQALVQSFPLEDQLRAQQELGYSPDAWQLHCSEHDWLVSVILEHDNRALVVQIFLLGEDVKRWKEQVGLQLQHLSTFADFVDGDSFLRRAWNRLEKTCLTVRTEVEALDVQLAPKRRVASSVHAIHEAGAHESEDHTEPDPHAWEQSPLAPLQAWLKRE
jgi:hypothetical protein